MTEKEIIEFWKVNEKPFGLCPEECREWMLNGVRDVLVFTSAGWLKANTRDVMTDSTKAYRLSADYQAPKVGRWVECDVFRDGPDYAFIPLWEDDKENSLDLYQAPGMVGFGGVFYPGVGWCDYLRYYNGSSEKPIAPTKVRFWVED